MVIYVYIAALFCGVLIFLSNRSLSAPSGIGLWGKKLFPLLAALLLLAALTLRLVFGYWSEGFSVDMGTFKSWGYTLGQVGFADMYQQDIFLDYPPGYLYILMLLEKLRQALGLALEGQAYTLVMKLPSVLADLLCGGVLLWLGKRKLGEWPGLLVSAAYLFCPAVYVNSAQWGQADSFCTAILLASVLLLYGEMYIPSGLLYGVSIICKPQMLVFAPLYLCFAIKRKRWLGLGLGIGCAVLALLALATPFTHGFNYWWLVTKYQSTMNYYDYYSVNACNFWSLIGYNWRQLPQGLHAWILTVAVPVLATAACGVLVFLSKRKDAVFAAAPVLMGIVYIFSIKMHERYLFPALLFMLLAFVFTGDKRLLRSYGLWAGVNYLNVSYVLWLFRELGGNYDPNASAFRLIAAVQVAALGYMVWAYYKVYIKGDIREPAPATAESFAAQAVESDPVVPEGLEAVLAESPEQAEPARKKKRSQRVREEREEKAAAAQAARRDRKGRPVGPPIKDEDLPRNPTLLTPDQRKMRPVDWAVMLAITLAYGVLAFWHLGGTVLPSSNWTPGEGESVVLHAPETCQSLYYLPGLSPDANHYAARVGSTMRIETSEDGVTWNDCGETDNDYVFAWKIKWLDTPGSYVRLTALDGSVTLSEAGLLPAGAVSFPAITAEGPGAERLVDEQDTVPVYKTYENSSYFDEIYHARTAYEHILGLEPYENTHPPLGKHIISLGIRMFGLNPFGWRFMGALFGVLMLPAFYALCKQLLGKPWLCGLCTALFSLDFMHFTQTRIATIDTYAVFFLILMYTAMVRFLYLDITKEKMGRLLLPLACSGVLMGLGVASKWTAAYGAVGLAVLFFGKLIVSYRQQVKARRSTAAVVKRAFQLCLWCCLLFIAIPFAIYYCAFLPMTTLPHNADNSLWAFLNYQTTMFNYHSKLVAEHSFASNWYEWPLVARPIWFFGGDGVNAEGAYSTISSMGNPLIWWTGLFTLIWSVGRLVKEKSLNCAVALTGFLAVYMPWVLVPRLTFIYHYFTAVPFLLLTVGEFFRRLEERGKLGAPAPVLGKWSISRAQACMGLLALCSGILFVVYFPVISGAPTTHDYANALELFTSWYF